MFKFPGITTSLNLLWWCERECGRVWLWLMPALSRCSVSLLWWWWGVVAGLAWWAGRGVPVRLVATLYMLVTALWSLPPWLYSRYMDPAPENR